MLNGAWPRTTSNGLRLADLETAMAAGHASAGDLANGVDRVVAEAVAAQVESGLGLVTDGGVRWTDPAVAVRNALRDGDTGASGMLSRAWRATAQLVDVPVAQSIPGPWTLAVRDQDVPREPGRLAARAVDLADALSWELAALAAAGCRVVQVMEPDAVAIGEDAAARAGFVAAQRRLLEQVPDLHTMLVVAGGSANLAGPGTIFDAPYRSYLFDLIAGPDNWYLVRAAPADRGIVCAALTAGGGAEDWDQVPQLVWAARYAASAGSRGMERVGLANATSLGDVNPNVARRAIEALARAAALAVMPTAEAIDAGLDPRAINTRPGPGGPA